MSLLPSRGHIAAEQIADLCRGKLTGPKAARVRSHIDSCDRCTQAEKRLAAGLVSMADIADTAVPDLGWDHIGARVYWSTSSERRAKERGPTSRRILWVAGSAGVVAMAGAALLIVASGRLGDSASLDTQISLPAPAALELASTKAPTTKPEPIPGAIVFAQGPVETAGGGLQLEAPVHAGTEYRTGAGRLVVQFGESSAFRVAPNSKLVIERLDSKRIALRIDGRVEVDSTRRLPGQEFVVIAGKHEVQVRGTAFRVDYNEGDLGVQCIRGKVVVTDGGHGVHVPAGQRFEILRDALGDAALRALPINGPALEALGQAMEMPMLATWDPKWALNASTAFLEVAGSPGQSIAVDGSFVAEGAFALRTSIGPHEVALVDRDGGVGQSRPWSAIAGQRTLASLPTPTRPALAGRAERKRQLLTAMSNSKRAHQCLAKLAKQGLLSGAYLVLEVGVNADGSQHHLNLLDSNLSPSIQSCLRDVVDAEQLPEGSAASFRFRLSY
jgi:ferric-dicitrate binding protein FerR (iron transport regulator)